MMSDIWKSIATDLLWRNIMTAKNENSNYYITETGEIGRFLDSSKGSRKLTWKELALELGLFTKQLTPDGHDCKICPLRDSCKASFKNDPDQERCNEWKL